MIKPNLKNIRDKGVTITSLTIYVIVATIIIGVLLFLNVQFFSNMGELTKEANIDGNKIGFKAAFISDLKGSANVSEYSTNRIKLSNNVVWEIRELSDAKTDRVAYAIFRNDVKMADYIVKNPLVSGNNPYKFFDYDSIGNFVKTDWVYSDGNRFDYEYSSYLVGTTTKFVFVEDQVDASVLPTMIPLTTPKITSSPTPSPSPTPSATPAPTRPPVTLNSSIQIDSVYSTRKVQPGESVEFVIMFAESGDGIVEYPYIVSFEMKVVGPDGSAILSGDPLTIDGVTMNDEGVYRKTWTFNNASELNDSTLNPKKFSVLISRTLPAGSIVITNLTDSNETFDIPIEQNVKIQQPSRKNIVMLLDTSGSMCYCLEHCNNNDSDSVRQNYLFPTEDAIYHDKHLLYDSYRHEVCAPCGRKHVGLVVNYNNSEENRNYACTEHSSGRIISDNVRGYKYCDKCIEKVQLSNSSATPSVYKCSEHGQNSSNKKFIYESPNGVHYCTKCSDAYIKTKKCSIHGFEYMTTKGYNNKKIEEYCFKCAESYPARLAALQKAAKSFTNTILSGRGESENLTFTIIQFNKFITISDTLKNPSDAEVEQDIDKLRAADATYVNTGLDNAIKVFNSGDRMLPNAVNFLIFLSDGVPSSGQGITNNTLNRFKALNVESFAVGLGEEFAKNEMKKIVNYDDSRIFAAADEDNLIETFRSIALFINSMQTTSGLIDAIVDVEHMYPVILTGTKWDDLDHVVQLGKAANDTELENMYVKIDENGHVILDFTKYGNYTNFVVTFGAN